MQIPNHMKEIFFCVLILQRLLSYNSKMWKRIWTVKSVDKEGKIIRISEGKKPIYTQSQPNRQNPKIESGKCSRNKLTTRDYKLESSFPCQQEFGRKI